MLTVDLRRARIASGTRVLDIGCGGGRHAFACLKAGAEVVAIDLSEVEVKSVQHMVVALRDSGEIDEVLRAAPAVANALALPFGEDSFDAVIASEVLEHVLDDEAAMAELRRVLRPGAVLALSVPRTVPEALNWLLSRQYHETPGGHLRIYRRSQLWARLERAGLEVTGSCHRHGLHTPYWWLRCAVGIADEQHRLVAIYHRLLVWDIEKAPRCTRLVEGMLNPLIGKSLVVYAQRSP